MSALGLAHVASALAQGAAAAVFIRLSCGTGVRWAFWLGLAYLINCAGSALAGVIPIPVVLGSALSCAGWALCAAAMLNYAPVVGPRLVRGHASAGWVAAALLGTVVVATACAGDPAFGLQLEPMLALGIGALFARLRLADETRLPTQARPPALPADVEQRIASLEKTISELESFNRAVSHDLRGPLGGIANMARIAQELLQSGELGPVAGMLGVISTQADASRRLVDGLLELARAQELALQIAPVDTQQLVHDVIGSIEAVGLRPLPVRLLNRLPVIEADADLLRQVFVNLIGNAVKFSAGARQPQVEIGTEMHGQQLTFLVRDNGVGFSPDEAAGLFKPFRRLHAKGFEGHGVGLSIVRRVVESHGGRVWAQAAVGAGATFYFQLGRPRADPSSVTASQTPALETS